MKEPSEYDFGNNPGEHTDPNPSSMTFISPTCPRCGGEPHEDKVGTYSDGNVCSYYKDGQWYPYYDGDQWHHE